MYWQAYTQQTECLASQHLTRRFELTDILDYTKELHFSGERHGSGDQHRSPDRAVSSQLLGAMKAHCLLTEIL